MSAIICRFKSELAVGVQPYTKHGLAAGVMHLYPTPPQRGTPPSISTQTCTKASATRQLHFATTCGLASSYWVPPTRFADTCGVLQPEGAHDTPLPRVLHRGHGVPLRSTGFALHAVIPSSPATCKGASRSTGTPKTTVYTTNVILHKALGVPLHPLSATTTIFAPQGRPRMPRPSSRPPFPSCRNSG